MSRFPCIISDDFLLLNICLPQIFKEATGLDPIFSMLSVPYFPNVPDCQFPAAFFVLVSYVHFVSVLNVQLKLEGTIMYAVDPARTMARDESDTDSVPALI